MAKRSLSPDLDVLEREIIKTLIVGCEASTDLSYPASYSDMQAAVRALLKKFDIKRLPLPRTLTYAD